MGDPGVSDEHLAMKLQVEEGLPAPPPPDDDEVFVPPPLAPPMRPPPVAAARQSSPNGSDKENDQQEYFQQAWALQVEENKQAVVRASQEPAPAEDNIRELQNGIRMGQAPYVTTVEGRRQRNLIGDTGLARARQQSALRAVDIELPPALAGAPTETTVATTPTSSALTTPESSVTGGEKSIRRCSKVDPLWYDVARPEDGDPVFLTLLGSYEDRRFVQLNNLSSWSCGILSQDPTALGAVVVEIKPENIELQAPVRPVSEMSLDEVIHYCCSLQIPFRQAALRLPFCVRFQLERCMLMDSDGGDPIIYLKKKYPPKRKEWYEEVKAKNYHPARKMILVFLQTVLPPLLQSVDRLQGSLTLQELFADDLYESLRRVKREIVDGKRVSFSKYAVEEALNRALDFLKGAEKLCQCKEEDLEFQPGLDNEAYLLLMRKRSLWPMAEYRARFTLDGRLLAKGFEMKNKAHAKRAHETNWTMKKALKLSAAETRRGIRELGWSLRERFLVFSDVPFNDIFQENLTDWCRDRATVCGRRYEFLFDKGASKVSLWFFAPSEECSREDYLRKLGSFGNVHESKLGDRISLAFTLTKPLVQLNIDQIVPIDEVVGNKYRFSDGCGVMGMGIAKRINEIEGRSNMPIHGAIQIRMGGIKGMLAVKKDFPDDKIGIRPSMCKFPSNHRLLEVKTVAWKKDDMDGKEKSLFYPALLIMHHLGVPSDVFLDLQRRAWAKIALHYDKAALGLLQEPVDFGEISRYNQRAVKGRKENGEPFTVEELEQIIKKMEAGKGGDVKVSLSCSITLMQGVLDEHNILEEKEVLVGNGDITGKVLILRPPCNSLGDIQAVTAVGKRDGKHFKALANCVVFSAKGDRPLQDMLAGGDLDGDEYYIVKEKALVDAFNPTTASEFGSQKEDIEEMIQISDSFPSTHDEPPALSKQLRVLQRYMENGDVVVSSAEAWARIADWHGAGHEKCLKVASVSARALDARKNGCVFSRSEMEQIDQVLSEHHDDRIPKPKWRGGAETNHPNSILGALLDNWESKINEIKATRNYRKQPSGDSSVSEGSVASEITQDTRQFDAEAGQPALSRKNGTEILIDVTFGRKERRFQGTIKPINFQKISESQDRLTLVQMVLLEYEHSLKKDLIAAERRHGGDNKIREYEVFLVRKHFLDPEELAVCVPTYRSGEDYEFRLKDGTLPINDVVSKKNVTSISSYSRILDAILHNPVPQLMKQAMGRSQLVDPVDPNGIRMGDSFFSSLNSSQRKAVATILSDSFRTGFFAIQGPPGSGKTSTIVAMVSAAKRALVLAPSNAAVANVARRLIDETGQFRKRDIVVWGDNCDESVAFLNPRRRYAAFRRFSWGYQETDEDKREQKLYEFAYSTLKWEEKDKRELSFEEVEEECSDADGLRSVDNARVILCTLNSAGSLALRKAVKHSRKKFELCVLDEASQCSEAEFYIATTFPFVRRIVVVGDPRQLGPLVHNKACENAGYGESFLGNIMKYHPSKVHFLSTQYRMDPSKLLGFVNETFYGNRLLSADSVRDRQPRVNYPFQFISISKEGSGTEERKGSDTSWCNEYEVGVIKAILNNDADIKRVQEETDNARIIVITPYKSQAERLRKVLKKVGVKAYDISTVDSFQGQEGDIVLVSTVRTDSVGFVDNAHRLCVALTRHRRILRVVGDLKFFKKLASDDSVLKRLADFSEKSGLVEDASVESAAWRRPLWKPTDTSWMPTMVSRFYGCVHKMEIRDRNVAFNTLYTLATPDLKKLVSAPIEGEPPRWQMSSLKGYENVYVMWLAKHYQKTREQQYVGVLEAHFAGSRDECLHFKQCFGAVPSHSACCVKRDLTGTTGDLVMEDQPVHSTQVDMQRWTVTSDIQNAADNGEIMKLPEGLFDLDDQQQKILFRKLPLVLESRSGTGKTNVLFQHAVCHLKKNVSTTKEESTVASILFVTVSSKLQQDLMRRYNEVKEIAQNPLPQITFYSLKELLQSLLSSNEVKKTIQDACTFLSFVYDRKKKSHLKGLQDSSLVQNEIGGVICGSLNAALKGKPLDEKEYLLEKRSNIPNKDDEGRDKRRSVYEEFKRYGQWKKENDRYDLGDIVLELIRLKGNLKCQNFVSAYLDEVQDFSYAMIYLICGIAGKVDAHWVAAGDTAQMISPGCSFQFAGLQDTLREVKPGVELQKVEQLKRNYRMTRSVLELGNSILLSLKKEFPGQVEYTQPEVSMKDLGFRVFLVKWSDAISVNAKLGTQQAIVYSGSGNKEMGLLADLQKWTGTHPLIISVLDAKGLEYDDIIVAFDKERSAWIDSSGNRASNNRKTDALKNLRELYVAVTRAKKRVVILTRDQKDVAFFSELSCGLETSEASVALLDFYQETSADEWFGEGMRYFEEEKFGVAENCFIKAENFGWSNRSQGKNLLTTGRRQEAKLAFRTSSKSFYESSKYADCLDVMLDLAAIRPWEAKDNQVLDAALNECPHHLPREWTVRFAIFRDEWASILATDLQRSELAADFRDHRNEGRLKTIIRTSSHEDRAFIKRNLPVLIGDYCLEQRQYPEACELFINANEVEDAVKATEKVISNPAFAEGDVLRVVKAWNMSKPAQRNTLKGKVADLLSLFKNPTEAANTSARKVVTVFGLDIVRLAVTSSGVTLLLLHEFDKKAFHEDVEKTLIQQYSAEPMRIVEWYLNHEDRDHATGYVEANLTKWSNHEFIRTILGTNALRPAGMEEEIQRREIKRQGALLEAVRTFLNRDSWDLDMAEKLSNVALASLAAAEQNATALRREWEPLRDDALVKRAMTKKQKSFSSKIFLLIKMFAKPEKPDQQRDIKKDCFSSFGAKLVKEAVKRGDFGKQKTYDILVTYNKTAFESEKPPPPTEKPRPNRGTKFSKNDRVRVVGLTSPTGQNLNGKLGTITITKEETPGRFGVLIDGEDSKPKSIKEENLRKLDRSEGNDEDGDGKDKGKARAKAKKIDNRKPPPGTTTQEEDRKPAAKAKAKQDNRKPAAKPKQDKSKPTHPPAADSSSDSSDDNAVPHLAERNIVDSSDEEGSSSSSSSSPRQSSTKRKASSKQKKTSNNSRSPFAADNRGFSDSDSDESSVPGLADSHFDENSSDEDKMPRLLERDKARHNSSSSSSEDDEEKPPRMVGRTTNKFDSSSSSGTDDVPPPPRRGRSTNQSVSSSSSDSSDDQGPPDLAKHKVTQDSSSSDDSDSDGADMGIPGFSRGGRSAAPPPRARAPPARAPAAQAEPQAGRGGGKKKKNRTRGGRKKK